jgi:hypothetical protein
MFRAINIFSLILLYSLTLHAAEETIPTAVVHKVLGTVLFEGRPVKLGDSIDKAGLLETSEKSVIQLTVAKWGNSITLGPLSSMMLNFSDAKKYTLDKGSCRWKTAVNAAKELVGGKGKIYTRHIAMGVRGTDFLIKTNALLGESEIIMFDGEVQMDNLSDPENTVVVKKGQWGGVGGRYGKKIAPPLDLPQAVLDLAEKVIKVE